MADLLPCPFCGGRPAINKGQHNFVDVHISCTQCEATGPSFDNDPPSGGFSKDPEADAIAHWNTRHVSLMPVYGSKEAE